MLAEPYPLLSLFAVVTSVFASKRDLVRMASGIPLVGLDSGLI
jgi:hypothetical protein